MALIDDYLQIAELAFDPRPVNFSSFLPVGFTRKAQRYATRGGDGFQGVVCESASDTIIAFSGTVDFPTPHRSTMPQWGAGAQTLVRSVPNAARSAYAFTRANLGSGARVSVCGHSLGGALAQVVGYWMGVPFVSFNGRGMATAVHKRKNEPATVTARVRPAVGISFHVSGDVLSKGTCLGTTVPLKSGSSFYAKHGIAALRNALGTDAWKEPSHWVPAFTTPCNPSAPPQLPDIIIEDDSLSPF